MTVSLAALHHPNLPAGLTQESIGVARMIHVVGSLTVEPGQPSHPHEDRQHDVAREYLESLR